jgi:uncharacterized protein
LDGVSIGLIHQASISLQLTTFDLVDGGSVITQQSRLEKMEEGFRYKSFNAYLREKFGERVYRVPIDAGFTCPNRDGERAFGGCTFCDDRGSGAPTIDRYKSVSDQLEHGIARIRRRFKAKKFLAYFQAFTNTYAPEGILRQVYDLGLAHPDVVGLCIGTRPDCLPDNVLDLLAEYNERIFTWLEIGLQSQSNRTLELINRGHSAEEFFDAVKRAKKRNLQIATHVIFGLPGESEKDMLETIKRVAESGIQGVKIHQLCIYKGTPLEKEYCEGRLEVMNEDTYIELVVRALELLPPDMVIMRLVAEGSRDEMIAPAWSFEKERIAAKIDRLMEERQSYQGKNFASRPKWHPDASKNSISQNVTPLANKA